MTLDDAATVAGAVGTVGTFLIALHLLYRQQQDQRRAHAKSISAWVTQVGPRRNQTEHGAINAMAGESVLVRVSNGSKEPALGAYLRVWFNYDSNGGATIGQEFVVPPGETDLWVDGVELPESGLAGYPRVDLAFADSRGTRWKRSYDGTLGPDDFSPAARRVARSRAG